MNRVTLILLSLFLTSCSLGPLIKVNRCHFKAKWGIAKSSDIKRTIVTTNWRRGEFSFTGEITVDLSKREQTDGNFSCKRVKQLNVRTYKTWDDIFWNLIPFFYSSHFEVTYVTL